MVVMNLKIWASKEKHGTAIHNLKTIMEPTKVQPGCLGCHIYEELEKNSPILFIEEWESEKQLQNHLHSEEFKVLLAMMELSESKPVFKIDSIAQSRGIESIT